MKYEKLSYYAFGLLFGFLIATKALAAETCSTSVAAETVEEQMEIKTDVPKFLEGKEICIRDPKTGISECVPTAKFKVVPRKQQFIVAKTTQYVKTSCSSEIENKKNRISLMAGNGPKEGLDRAIGSSSVSVESRVGAIGGAQYQRLLNDRLSLGAQLQTNKSVLVNLGLDF